MVAPYTPTAFSSPLVNPSVGGWIKPTPYISVAQYQYAPTAMDTVNLVPDGEATDQTQALYDTIIRASGWADRFVFGASPSGKGASLCASQSVETAWVKVLQGELRLVCSYKPIVEVDGIDIGCSPAAVQPISANQASSIRIGTKVIYVPFIGSAVTLGGLSDTLPGYGYGTRQQRLYAVWSYVNGYPHLQLAADAAASTESITVLPNGPGNTLLGVYPGTPLSIDDWGQTESITVASVSGTTINLTEPLVNEHTIPTAPDFTPVTALPADVIQAVIFLTTALIKTRGDNSIVLDGITEPRAIKPTADAVTEDVENAFHLLRPFRSASKIKS